MAARTQSGLRAVVVSVGVPSDDSIRSSATRQLSHLAQREPVGQRIDAFPLEGKAVGVDVDLANVARHRRQAPRFQSWTQQRELEPSSSVTYHSLPVREPMRRQIFF